MTWTTISPTAPGWYGAVFNDAEIVRVNRLRDGRLVVGDDESYLPLSDFSHWYGPIELPEPPPTVQIVTGGEIVGKDSIVASESGKVTLTSGHVIKMEPGKVVYIYPGPMDEREPAT